MITASFWQPRSHWYFRSQNSTHLSVSGQLPILLALLSYFHIKDWWTNRTPGKPIVKISLTIERQ
ncbi:TPA: hypothetical protein U1C44_001211 [Streptococcus suis]|nr:hypothetical protein [Streptococcus suis]